MKKYLMCVLLISLVMGVFEGCTIGTSVNNSSLQLKELKYEDIADKLIRFHVLANSDSKEDQALKLKVRDKVIEEMSLKLKDAATLEEAKEILISSIDEVNLIAAEVIEDNNYNYSVKTMLSNENFPDKIYGDYIFPQGNYQAFRIIIGDGEGQNWWCVMFPPLCFVDETKNTVNSKELEKNIEETIGTGNKSNEDKNEESKVVFKFKIFEILKDIF